MSLGFYSPVHAVGASKFTPLTLDDRLVKWGSAKIGTPAHVTYAFVEGPIVQQDARNCRAMDSLERIARRTGHSIDEIKAETAAAFQLWDEVSGITFSETENVSEADILVGAQSLPRGYAFTNVQYEKDGTDLRERAVGGNRGLNKPELEPGEMRSRSQDLTVAGITRSAVCLNPAHDWKIGFDGNLDNYDLRYTFAHEIGHAIGFDHHIRHRSIMHFKYAEGFRGLQPGDIEGVQWLYGPAAD
ncbi:matrixin family metalloprotease [Roseibium salinum]|nr:matrixin family metalloprotease [Roseibium salinum]